MKLPSSSLANWGLFLLLAFIWGSSFILMKEGLLKLTAFEVASIRIVASGLVLLPVALRAFREIPKNKIIYAFLSGVLGSLLPAYLFCLAEVKVDSALAGTLNSLTPIFVIVAGVSFFKQVISKQKIIGILIAFAGSALLLLSKKTVEGFQHLPEVSMIVVATIMYGVNVNMVHRHLKQYPAIQVVSIALVLCSIPALIVLFAGKFHHHTFNNAVAYSIGAAAVLGIFGTSLASILFYKLINRAGVVFASMVTYGIPFVASFWGLVYGEQIGWIDVICMIIILAGVYVANRTGRVVKVAAAAEAERSRP